MTKQSNTVAALNNNIEELLEESPQYWLDKMEKINQYFMEKVKRNLSYQHNINYHVREEILKRQSPKSKKEKQLNVFEHAPLSILQNEEVMLFALNSSLIKFYHLDETLQTKKDFVLKYLDLDYSYHFTLKKEMLEDEDIFIKCLKKDHSTYTTIHYSRALFKKYASKEKTLQFLEINPLIYKHLSEDLKSDAEVAEKAVLLDFKNIECMNKKISAKTLKDPELCRKIMEKNLDYFPKLNNKFRSDEEFLIPVLEKKPSLIEFVSPKLRSKKSFIEHAVGAYNLMEYISEDLKRDPELMQKHLMKNIFSVTHLEKYLDVVPLLVNVIKKEHHSYQYLPDNLKEQEDIIYALLHHDYFYEPIDNKTKYYANYERKAIIHRLPGSIIDELTQEYSKSDLAMQYSKQTVGFDEKLLEYARQKYSNLYLNKNLEQNDKKRKLKI